ncbi:hypothetical protein [Mesorhizobium sp.]|uniref:hypothetical protein n=1 Tax=Mesorhizobium sp. TaxID=1871066 RepID=UPI0025E5E456|nr:hypothetical protein [Mesorhizobium sp.]
MLAYYYSPGTDTCINANTGETCRLTEDGVVVGKTALASKVDDIDGRVQRAFEGASVASALTSPDLVQGEHFGVRVNWGNAGQSNAMGVTGAAVLGEGFFPGGKGRLAGAAGVAFSGKAVGGNAGCSSPGKSRGASCSDIFLRRPSSARQRCWRRHPRPRSSMSGSAPPMDPITITARAPTPASTPTPA